MPNVGSDVNHIEQLINSINFVSDSDISINNLNSFIDELNAYSYKTSLDISNERVDKLLRNICLKVPVENTLTVAKYCQLVLNLHSRKPLELTTLTLQAFTVRLTTVLSSRAHLSFLDILQLLRILITSHPDYFSLDHKELFNILLCEIEKDVTLVDAQAVKLFRLHCLLDLTQCLSQDESVLLIECLLDTLYSQDPSNPILLSKVWCACLEGIERALPKAKQVKDLSKLIGGVLAGLKLGLGAARPGGKSQRTAGPKRPDLPPKPVPVYPTPLPPLPVDSSNRPGDSSKGVGGGLGGGKKWKVKSKEVEWCGDESLACWPTERSASDSEASDSESGKRARELAKTRYSAAYTITHIAKVLDRKTMSGYYFMLLGSNCLQASLISDSMLKPKHAAIIATRAILLQAKPFLALAQHSELKSFTAYCEGLSELLVSLHSTIGLSLGCGGGHQVVASLLHCFSTLATVTPYHRLKQGLITRSLSLIVPHLFASHSKEVTAGVHCLCTYISLEPQTQELKDVLASGPPGCQSFTTATSTPWITSMCLSNLQNEDRRQNESLHIAYWQLLSTLTEHHSDEFVFVELAVFEDLIIAELGLSDQTPSIHQTILQTLAVLLEQLSEGGAKYSDECIALWNRLLDGPLIPFLQDATVMASFACDCLSVINQPAFDSLTEKRQIGMMTLVYGCCFHEEKSVRASAIKILGVLLNFPNVANETYLYDIIDILLRSVSDSSNFCRQKVAWAFGNLAELLRNKERETFPEEISIIKLIDACLILSKCSQSKDPGNIKVNVVRALGSLLSLISESDIKRKEFKDALDQSTTLLVKSTNSGIFMKVRWNACHAISHILANDALYLHSSNWFNRLVQSLCSLLVKCNHFKVRSNACAALRSIKKRNHFGDLYDFVWQSLVDGLDNSANMPNFKEYKQQNDLLNQLCMSVCHVLSLLEESDVAAVRTILEFRLECLSRYLTEFVSRAPPELTSTALSAHSNLTRLNIFKPLIAALTPAV